MIRNTNIIIKDYHCPKCGKLMATVYVSNIDGNLCFQSSKDFVGIDKPCKRCAKEAGEEKEKEMLTPKQAREIADKVNKEKRNSLSGLYQNAWMKHQKYIEESIKERAEFGEYRCMSENLYDAEYQDLVEYDPEDLEEFLKDKIKRVFGEALGYKIIDTGSNYLIISWE